MTVDFAIEQHGDALRLLEDGNSTELQRTIWQFSVRTDHKRRVAVRHEATIWEERKTRRHKWSAVQGWWWNSNFQFRGHSSDFYVQQPDADPKIIEFALAYVRSLVVYEQPDKPGTRTGQRR